MSNLIERLRKQAWYKQASGDDVLMKEAANRIAGLEADLAAANWAKDAHPAIAERDQLRDAITRVQETLDSYPTPTNQTVIHLMASIRAVLGEQSGDPTEEKL